MLVKLSGNKYINSDAIAYIEPLRYQPEESNLAWIVRFVGERHPLPLTYKQFGELMHCLPTPAQSLRHKESKGEAQ